jgi:hypothetical protein
VSRPVRQALALDASESENRPFPIVEAELDAMAVPELEFGQILLQVLFAAMLVGAAETFLELAEKVLRVIRGEAVISDILTMLMKHSLVCAELAADLAIDQGLIGD